MSFNDIYRIIEKFFFDLFDKWVLVGIAIFLLIFSIIGGVVFIGYKIATANKGESFPEQKYFIEQNAMSYCTDKSFDSWRFKNTTEGIDYTKFECVNSTYEKFDITTLVNMS